MKNTKNLIFSILILISLSAFSTDNNVQIKGKIENANGRTIYLQKFENNKNVILDSVIIKKSGDFLFKITVNDINFYSLKLSKSQPNELILLILDNNISNNKISFYANADSLISSYTVEGSYECDLIKTFINKINQHQTNRNNVSNLISSKVTSNEEKIKYKKRIDSLDLKFKLFLNEFIDSNFEHLAVIITAGYLNPQQDLKLFKKIESGLKKSAPNSEYHKAFVSQIKQIEDQLSIQQKQKEEREKQNNSTSIGKLAPELNFPDPNGKIITLESLKGKYVLIDFWASWCKPCRMENPNVVKLYNKYKEKGFTVYSVSLDNNKDRWVNAIKQDNLSWPNHVSDLKQWQTEATKIYGFRGIPYTVLIDKEGKIVAKNLRGPTLENKLKEIFGE